MKILEKQLDIYLKAGLTPEQIRQRVENNLKDTKEKIVKTEKNLVLAEGIDKQDLENYLSSLKEKKAVNEGILQKVLSKVEEIPVPPVAPGVTDGPPPPPGLPPGLGNGPPPPPSMGGKKKKTVKKPKKPTKEELPAIISEQDLKALSKNDKKASDQLFLAPFLNIDSSQKDNLYTNFDPNKSLGFYLDDIKKAFAHIRLNKDFKKRKEFDELFGVSRKRGLLHSFFEEKIEKVIKNNNESLSVFYVDLQDVEKSQWVKNFKVLLSSCLFESGSADLAGINKTCAIVLTNALVIARQKGSASRYDSDYFVFDLVKTILQKTKTSSVEHFGWQLNLVRIYPQFIKYKDVMGSVADSNYKGASGGVVGKAKFQPLLQQWFKKEINNKDWMPLSNFASRLSQQFFYGDYLDQLLSESDNKKKLESLLEKHIGLLKEKKTKSFDINNFLKNSFSKVKDINSLRKAIKELKTNLVEGKKKIAEKIESMMQDLSIDVDQFKNQLNVIIADDITTVVENFADIEKIITDYNEKNKIVSKVINIFKEVKEKYKKEYTISGEYKSKGKVLYDKLIQVPNIKNQVEKEFTSIYRTARSIHQFINSIVKDSKLMNAHVKIDDMYNFIEPYGTLVRVLEQIPKEKEDLLLQLQYALQYLNDGQVFPKFTPLDGTSDGAAISQQKIYENKLKDAIKALQDFDFETLKKVILAFVKKAELDVENNKDLQNIIKNAFMAIVNQKFKSFVRAIKDFDGSELKSLKRGDYRYDRRNIAISKVLKDIFKPIFVITGNTIQEFTKQDIFGAQKDQWDKSVEAIKKDIQEKLQDKSIQYIATDENGINAERDKIEKEIVEYVDLVKKQIEQMYKTIKSKQDQKKALETKKETKQEEKAEQKQQEKTKKDDEKKEVVKQEEIKTGENQVEENINVFSQVQEAQRNLMSFY